jgi:cytochrome c553
MKKYRAYIVGAIGGVMAAAIVPLTGIIDFDASDGQWGVTDWFYGVSARQSITLRSAGVAVPDLSDPAAIRRGAGHYEMVCATCHGSPAGAPEQFADDLVPAPPRLVEQMRNWRPEARVFWTVKHGIKRTAMPAWPTQLRDDEVWDMVAFLNVMAAMPPAEYAEHAGLDRNGCASCHGENGEGNGAAPRLDIQSPQYIAASLEAFRQRTRASGTMIAAASRLSDEEISELSAYFGRLVAAEGGAGAGLGADIAARGIPDRDIAACDSCHGEAGRPEFPKLMGQDRDYLVTQLELFNEHGLERGGLHADIMVRALRVLPQMEEGPLTHEEIEALADHYGR